MTLKEVTKLIDLSKKSLALFSEEWAPIPELISTKIRKIKFYFLLKNKIPQI